MGEHTADCWIPCGVEGCPRVAPEGDAEACGLTKVLGPGFPPDHPLAERCHSKLQIDHWFIFTEDGQVLDRPCSFAAAP